MKAEAKLAQLTGASFHAELASGRATSRSISVYAKPSLPLWKPRATGGVTCVFPKHRNESKITGKHIAGKTSRVVILLKLF